MIRCCKDEKYNELIKAGYIPIVVKKITIETANILLDYAEKEKISIYIYEVGYRRKSEIRAKLGYTDPYRLVATPLNMILADYWLFPTLNDAITCRLIYDISFERAI